MYGDLRFDKVWGGRGTRRIHTEGTEITEGRERLGLEGVKA